MRTSNAHVYTCLSIIVLTVASVCPMPLQAAAPRPVTDAAVSEMIAGAKDAEDYPGADVVAVLDEADVTVSRSGLATTLSRQVIKVLTDEGARKRTTFTREFDPATNRVTLRQIRIHRADGTVQNVNLQGLRTQPAVQRSIYWGNQQYVLDLPDIRVGDSIEYRIDRVGYNIAYLADTPAETALSARGEPLRPPMPGHWYEVTLFQEPHPIIYKRYSVHLPRDLPVQYEVYNGPLSSSLWFDGDHHVYTWSASDIPALRREPHMVAASDCVPKVVLATVPDWETKSRWFYEANEAQFEPDDDIRAKVEEITAGLTDEDQRIAAVTYWVANQCRYVGTSRGQHEGFTLHKSRETFRDRGGVCKDKAGMLVTMLRVMGHEAYAALTMAGSRVEEIPADQFNHTVTVIRKADDSFQILDPTWAPLSRELWSSREALQGLVYGTPEGQQLTLSPYFPPDYNRLRCNAATTLRSGGSLDTEIRMEMHGYPCTAFRRTLARSPIDDQRGVIEAALRLSPDVVLTRLDHSDLVDYSRESHIDMSLQSSNYVMYGPQRRMFRLPLLRHNLAKLLFPDVLYERSPERRYGLRLRATRLIRYDERITLPGAWHIERMPEAVALDNEAASLSFEISRTGSELTYRCELALKHHIIEPELYPAYNQTLEALERLSEEWVICRLAAPSNPQAAATLEMK